MAAAGPGTSGGLPLRPAMNTGRESDDAVSPRGTPKGTYFLINLLAGICASKRLSLLVSDQ